MKKKERKRSLNQWEKKTKTEKKMILLLKAWTPTHIMDIISK